jgi:hypothetical protein
LADLLSSQTLACFLHSHAVKCCCTRSPSLNFCSGITLHPPPSIHSCDIVCSYLCVPKLLIATGATFLNLSLLTSDFFAVAIGDLFFGFVPIVALRLFVC